MNDSSVRFTSNVFGDASYTSKRAGNQLCAKSPVHVLLLVLLGCFPCARPEAAPGSVAGPGVPPPALALPGDLLHGPQDGVLHDLSAGGLQLCLFRLTSRLLTWPRTEREEKAQVSFVAGVGGLVKQARASREKRGY